MPARDVTVLDLDTPYGPARAHLEPAADPVAALVLGHGAGGGVAAPDLRTAARAAVAQGASVALVEQPYRVAGRRSTPAAHQLDAAWTAVLTQLRAGPLAGLDVVAGGRSSGARVACRTAEETGAVGVLCLAFPLRPPARRSGTVAPSRQEELDAVRVPVLVVQGRRDRFGMPAAAPGREVVEVDGDHSLRTDRDTIAGAVQAWLAGLLG